jgi:TolB-like protein/AraC-like DNA-binding protein/Tfp pilus assembly protein PilF
MSDPSFIGTHFIDKAKALIVENLSNEQFGVSELAEAMNMSRSNLLRKIKKQTQLSASQFIRQVRLQKGMELLKETSLTVSEISYQVGFGSTSYFIKCFREHYGYPPGEVGKGTLESEPAPIYFLKQYRRQIIAVASLVVLAISLFLFSEKHVVTEVKLEKSIAVLPFKNESSDSTNLYFVNGLMESALGNLQKIEDLRVLSRTSVEKYRNTEKGIAEIAEELNVNYLVEGSGQRVGDQVLLNIQLIEASTDRPIWVEQYSREVDDIFALQNEVARKIAVAIEAMVTPAELEQIEKLPTESLLAYDYYLQALDPFHTDTKQGWEKAILLFEKAIEQDSQFALAYANISISYYYLDIIQKQQKYKEQINNYADKALLYDSKSDISLIAKALYYMYNEEYRLALPHLKKALEYNPNSSAVVRLLSLLYANYIPDTGQALKYALMDMQLDIAANDSIAKSYIYLNLSNALIQNGFPEEALTYTHKSLDLYPENSYAPWLKTMILFTKNSDIESTATLLEKEWQKDTTRLDILQEVANFHYYQEDYDGAFFYFEKFIKAKEKYGLDIYPQEDLKVGLVYQKKGLDAQATKFFNSYAAFCEKDESIYKSMNLAMKYVNAGKNDQAIAQLNVFATQENYFYWILIYLEIDPLMKPLKNHPEFKEVIQKIEDRFWKNQTQLRKSLEEKGLI